MPKITVVTRNNDEIVLDAKNGRSVMESIRDGGIHELLSVCGGCCSCATCHVYIDTAWSDHLTGPGEMEQELLDSSEHRQSMSRLSCQITMADELDGFRVTIAPED